VKYKGIRLDRNVELNENELRKVEIIDRPDSYDLIRE